MLSDTRLSLTMDLAMLEAIKYVKQISKTNVFLGRILQRINKMNAANIDTDYLKIDVDNMFRNGITDQDYKILKNHTDGDVTLDTTHFSTESTNNTHENKHTNLPFPLTQLSPNKSDKDPTLVKSYLENNTTVLAVSTIDTQETLTNKTQSTLSVHENN